MPTQEHLFMEDEEHLLHQGGFHKHQSAVENSATAFPGNVKLISASN